MNTSYEIVDLTQDTSNKAETRQILVWYKRFKRMWLRPKRFVPYRKRRTLFHKKREVGPEFVRSSILVMELRRMLQRMQLERCGLVYGDEFNAVEEMKHLTFKSEKAFNAMDDVLPIMKTLVIRAVPVVPSAYLTKLLDFHREMRQFVAAHKGSASTAWDARVYEITKPEVFARVDEVLQGLATARRELNESGDPDRARLLEDVRTLQRRARDAKLQINAWGRNVALEQMDAFESMAMGVVTDCAAPILHCVADSVDKRFGGKHDSPAIPDNRPGNMAGADLPRPVAAMSFKKNDFTGSSYENFSQDGKVDVMDLVGRCEVPSLVRRITWSTSDAVGKEILGAAGGDLGDTFQLNPGQPFKVSRDTAQVRQVNTMLSYLADMYAYWRGPLVFTIEVVTTKFHQGQLFACFTPGNIPSSATLDQCRNCAAATIDLSTSNRTKFVIPYVSKYDYCLCVTGVTLYNTSSPYAIKTAYNTVVNDDNYRTGQLRIFVQNPLVAPMNVTASIDVNVYISAGPGFEFKVPRKPRMDVKVNEMPHASRWVEQMETIVDVAAAPPAHQPIAGFDPQNEKEAAIDCNVAAASLGTIVQRDYLLQTGLTWSTSKVVGSTCMAATVAGLFKSKNISIRGLMDYHSFVRSTFEVTIRFNAAPFFAGQLMLLWSPEDIYTDTNYPTFTQLPHAMLNPASETSATIKVPWGELMRLITSADFDAETVNLGVVYVLVWNQLRPATGGTQELKGSVWGHFVDPYVGVKRPNMAITATDLCRFTATEEMALNPTHPEAEPIESASVADIPQAPAANTAPVAENEVSDGASGKSTGGNPFKPLRKGIQDGHIRSWHGSARDMMKRPNFVGMTKIAATTGGVLTRIANLGSWGGETHDHLRVLYYAWSGTMRYTVMTNAAQADRCLLGVVPRWGVYSTDAITLIGGTVAEHFGSGGSVFWSAAQEPIKTVSVPFYCHTPAMYCPVGPTQKSSKKNTNHSEIELVMDFMPKVDTQKETISVRLYEAAGDDFQFYMPLPCPDTGYAGTAAPIDGALPAPTPKPKPGPPRSPPPGWAWEQMADFPDASLQDVDREVSRLSKIMVPVQALCQFFKWVLGKIKAGISYVSFLTLTQRVKAVQDGVMAKILPILTWVLDFIVNLYCIFSETSATCKALALTALSAKCATAYVYGTELLEQLTQATEQIGFLDVIGSNTAIAGIVATAMVAGLLSLIGYGVSSSDAKTLRDTATWKFAETCTATSKIASGVTAVPKLWSMASSGIKTGLEYFLEGKDMFANWYDSRSAALSEWQRQVDEDYLAGRFDNNNAFSFFNGESNYQRLMNHAEVAAEIRAHQGAVQHFPVTWSKTAEKVMVDAARVKKAFEYANGRVEPVGIYVQGSAGSGKSLAWTKFFPYLIMKRAGLVGTFEEAKRQTFSKPTDPNQRFMDGYMAQMWVGVDDFGASSTDEDAVEMINLISVSNCPVNMADLAEKKTLFTSKFVCATTNQSSTQAIVTLRDKQALKRRFPFPICQEVRPDYQVSGKLNVSKMQDEMEKCLTLADWEALADRVWKFKKLDINNGAVTYEVSCEQLVGSISDCYLQRTRLNDSMDRKMATLEMWGGDIEMTPVSRFDAFPEFVDAPDRVETPTAGVRYRRAAMMARSWKTFRSGDLDKAAGRAYLVQVRNNYVEYGFKSREEFETTVRTSAPGVLSDSRSYVGEEPAVFFAWMRMMYDIPGTVLSDGPEPKPWVGLVKWLLPKLAIAAGASMLAYGIYRFFKAYVFKSLDATEQGPNYTGEKRYQKMGKKIAPKPRIAREQGKEEDDVVRKMQKAIRRLEYSSNGQKKGTIHCLALDSQHLLVNGHFWRAVENAEAEGGDVCVYLEQVNHRGEPSVCAPITQSNTLRERVRASYYDSAVDAMVVRLVGTHVFHARSIWHFFLTDSDFENFFETQTKTMRLETKEVINGIWDGSSFITGFEYQGRDNTYAEMRMAKESKQGDCGFPYILHSPRHTRRVIGIHSLKCHTGEVGVSFTTADMLEEARVTLAARLAPQACEVKPFSVEQVANIDDTPLLIETLWDVPDMEIIGRVEINGCQLERYCPTRTAFERTGLLHPDWEDKYLPSQQRSCIVDGETVFPLYKNVQKFGNEAWGSIDYDLHMESVWHFMSKLPQGRGKILSWEEAINGVEPMKPLVMDTSTGFMAKWFQKGKKELFDPLPQIVNENGELEARRYEFSDVAQTRIIPIYGKSFVDVLLTQDAGLMAGEEPMTFWTATLKDELVKEAKVKACKTRVFVQPGVDFTIHMRRYFGDFCNEVKKRPGFGLHHLIAAEKDAVWKKVYEEFKTMDTFFDLDYSNYDGTVCGLAFDFFRRITDHFYGPKGKAARHALLYNLQNSVMIVGFKCVLVHQGNKSGNPLTDVFNSITNIWLMYVCFLSEARYRKINVTLDEFEMMVRFLTYGDDVIVGIRNPVKEWFNRASIAWWAKRLGMVATSAAKDGLMRQYEPLDGLTFLKSHFRPNGNVVLAPLPIEVIHREVIWQRKANAGDVTIFQQRIQTAVDMMCHHGEEETTKFLSQLAECNIHVNFSWEAWRGKLEQKQNAAQIERRVVPVDVDEWIMDQA